MKDFHIFTLLFFGFLFFLLLVPSLLMLKSNKNKNQMSVHARATLFDSSHIRWVCKNSHHFVFSTREKKREE